VVRDILNGEERSFFTELFAKHAGQLGEIKQGQKDIKEDIHDIKDRVCHMEEKMDRIEKETPTKRYLIKLKKNSTKKAGIK